MKIKLVESAKGIVVMFMLCMTLLLCMPGIAMADQMDGCQSLVTLTIPNTNEEGREEEMVNGKLVVDIPVLPNPFTGFELTKGSTVTFSSDQCTPENNVEFSITTLESPIEENNWHIFYRQTGMKCGEQFVVPENQCSQLHVGLNKYKAILKSRPKITGLVTETKEGELIMHFPTLLGDQFKSLY